jgi:hypothetical protein
MEPYPTGQFGLIDDPDCQFDKGSVWTQTLTRCDSPELLLTLDVNVYVDQQPLIESAGGHSPPAVPPPDVPLPDVSLPDVPPPDVPLPDVPLPEARPDGSEGEG